MNATTPTLLLKESICRFASFALLGVHIMRYNCRHKEAYHVCSEIVVEFIRVKVIMLGVIMLDELNALTQLQAVIIMILGWRSYL